MSILVTGGRGQVGREIARMADERGLVQRSLARQELDVTDKQAVERALAGVSVVVNCAAYTAVDQAESEPGKAFAVNRDGALTVAGACAAAGIPMVHVSSDYVFDGRKGLPYREEDPVSPLGVYGASKAAGEAAVAEKLSRHIILRTAWIFSPFGSNFVASILGAARRQTVVRVVDDQFGGPTAASDVAAAILRICDVIRADSFHDWGIYHLCGAPGATRYSFAATILGSDAAQKLEPVKSEMIAALARRPAFSMLDCSRISRTFGISQPSWQAALDAMRPLLPAAGAEQG